MGFGNLCWLYGIKLPRKLCYWLATQVDVDQRLLLVGGRVFSLSSNQVSSVLGIPMGDEYGGDGKKVPKKATTVRMKFEVSELKARYEVKVQCAKKEITQISRQKLEDALVSEQIGEEDFKIAFLIMALNDVLCPTTSHKISAAVLPAATLAKDAYKYDWCSFVLDHLFDALTNFSTRFNADGFASGCGGCTIFLAILYLDRLVRCPVEWGRYPRVAVWDAVTMSKVKKAAELPTGDYGSLACVDAAYGERHPLEPRDARLPVPGMDNEDMDFAAKKAALLGFGAWNKACSRPPIRLSNGKKKKRVVTKKGESQDMPSGESDNNGVVSAAIGEEEVYRVPTNFENFRQGQYPETGQQDPNTAHAAHSGVTIADAEIAGRLQVTFYLLVQQSLFPFQKRKIIQCKYY